MKELRLISSVLPHSCSLCAHSQSYLGMWICCEDDDDTFTLDESDSADNMDCDRFGYVLDSDVTDSKAWVAGLYETEAVLKFAYDTLGKIAKWLDRGDVDSAATLSEMSLSYIRDKLDEAAEKLAPDEAAYPESF